MLAVTVLWVQPVLAADDATAAVAKLSTTTIHRSAVVDEPTRSDSNRTIDSAGESGAADTDGDGTTNDKSADSVVDSGHKSDSPVISGW